MVDLGNHDGLRPKCYFTSSVLPDFVNHEQIPAKKKPFSTISQQHFNHTLTLVLPADQAEDLKRKLESDTKVLRYAQVYMKLGELIEGDFFNHYVKSGNVLMLSVGTTDHNNVYSLHEGILRLEVDKATYESMGLGGTAIPSGGRKHVKTKYAIELNLRLPAMVRGKHGFERIVWAFKNVLNNSVTWLFHDFNGNNDGAGPIAQHQPKMTTVKPELDTVDAAQIPEPSQDIHDEDFEIASDFLEWLTLVTMCSPRIQDSDKIDTYLSRYRTPDNTDGSQHTTQDLVRFQWHGFIPAIFIRSLVLAALKAPGTGWFGMTARSFHRETYSILQKSHHTMTWEYMD